MRNNKAVSMISLVITIILMIILASISGFYLFTTINNAQYKDAKESLRNVESVVEYAKTQILVDEFIPNTDNLISDAELDLKFGTVLSNEEIAHIKAINSDDTKMPEEKYYLMTQIRFDEEFGNDYNVSDLRKNSEYLVNYIDTTVVMNYGNQLLANKNIIPAPTIERGQIQLVYSPNGSEEWKTSQTTTVTLQTKGAISDVSMKYLWSTSYTEPSESEFDINGTNLSSGESILLKDMTGNDWYLWVFVKYKENNNEKKYITKSNPFYIDNTAPTGTLDVEEIVID